MGRAKLERLRSFRVALLESAALAFAGLVDQKGPEQVFCVLFVALKRVGDDRASTVSVSSTVDRIIPFFEISFFSKFGVQDEASASSKTLPFLFFKAHILIII